GIGQWSSHVSAPAIFPVQYDVLQDLEPVSLLPASPLWIVARAGFPANTLSELVVWLKANPGKASAALPAPGSGGHVALIHFQNTTGTKFQLVPYRGGAPAMQDLVAGHVDLMCGEATQMLSYVRGPDEGICDPRQEPLGRRSRRPHDRRGGGAGTSHFLMAWS